MQVRYVDKVLNVGETFIEDWFVWAIVLWLFFLVLHFINVFFTNRFMGKAWERKQTDKLLLKQKLKIAKLEKEMLHEAALKIESEQYAAELKKKENFKKNLNQE